MFARTGLLGRSKEPEHESMKEVLEAPKPPLFKRPAFRIAIGVVALAALVGGVAYYLSARDYENTDDAFIDGSVVQISPKVGGYANRVAVTDNQRVKKGDLLVEIDSRDYENRVLQAQAQLEAAKSRHNAANQTLALTRVTSAASVRQAAAGVSQARSAVESRQAQLDALKNQADRAQAQVTTQRDNVTKTKAQLIAAQAESARAQADAER